MKTKTVATFNSKGNLHGYQERYCPTTMKVTIRCVYMNLRFYGYVEAHTWKNTQFFIR